MKIDIDEKIRGLENQLENNKAKLKSLILSGAPQNELDFMWNKIGNIQHAINLWLEVKKLK